MDTAQGVETWRGHKLAVLASREGKSTLPEGRELVDDWQRRAASVGLDQQVVTSLRGRERRTERVVDVAIPEILGERGLTAEAATFTRRDLMRAVAAHSPLGGAYPSLEQAVDAVLANRNHVVVLGELTELAGRSLPESFRTQSDEDRRYSTPEMVAIEEHMLARAQGGRLAGRAIANLDEVEKAIAARPSMTGEQRTMVRAVCRDGQTVTLVEGSAGSGKTYALAACRDAFQQGGYQVVGAALSARAARTLGVEAGIPTATVHSLLRQLERESQPTTTVIVVDEAAMVGSRQVAQLVEYAARDRAKLVLVGDRHQLHPIDSGAAFRALGDHLGTVRLTQNVRQVDAWGREALDELRSGRVDRAVHMYLERGAVTTTGMHEAEVRDRMFADYRAAIDRGRDVLMVAHRRADVAELNQRAHELAAERGQLRGPSLHLGDGVVEPQREFRAGDLAICLQNDHERGLMNGMRVRVVHVVPDWHELLVRTQDNRLKRIDTRQYQALDHGYAMTVHKAQGHTTDVCLVMARGDEGRQWTYTAMSRGKEQNRYYTMAAPFRDTHGNVKGQEKPREVADRLTKSWSRTDEHDSTLDFERQEEKQRTLVQKVKQVWRELERSGEHHQRGHEPGVQRSPEHSQARETGD